MIIDQLTPTLSDNLTDEVPVEQGTVTLKTTWQKIKELFLGTTALPTTAQTITGAIAELDTDIDGIETEIGSTALPTTAQTLTGAIAEVVSDHSNDVLYLTSVACSATTGNFVSVSNASITADHVVAECVFANPSYITTDVTWTTGSGTLTLNGACSTATTVNLVLIKKDN